MARRLGRSRARRTRARHGAVGQLESGAIVLFLPPSARTGAMGRAGTAVFWGSFPDHWLNPALLPSHGGVRYEWSRTQLVPTLSDQVYFRANRLTVAASGLGFELSGAPVPSFGGLLLDYGETIITDFSGRVIGTFRPLEEVNTWGVGVNAIELVESLWSRAESGGGEPPLSGLADVSFGLARLGSPPRLGHPGRHVHHR